MAIGLENPHFCLSIGYGVGPLIVSDNDTSRRKRTDTATTSVPNGTLARNQTEAPSCAFEFSKQHNLTKGQRLGQVLISVGISEWRRREENGQPKHSSYGT